jgi:transcriptional/translational regulatory protein YebC/TACO1
MSKNGGNLGESGCVNWMFEKKGSITINKTDSINEEEIMEVSLDIDAEDFIVDEDCYEIITAPESFNNAVEYLEGKGYDYEGELGLTPTNMVKVSENDANSIIKLLELLEDNDDVQKIHSNFEVE